MTSISGIENYELRKVWYQCISCGKEFDKEEDAKKHKEEHVGGYTGYATLSKEAEA